MRCGDLYASASYQWKTCNVSCCSAVLAHYLLNEQLNLFGLLGGMLCITGSLTIVLHAPEETTITSVLQVWELALQPGQL